MYILLIFKIFVFFSKPYLGIHLVGVIFKGLEILQGFIAVVSTNKVLRHKIVAYLRPGRIVEQFT